MDAGGNGGSVTGKTGRFAEVVTGGTRRVNLDLQLGCFLPEQMPKYPLGRRAAANIAQAHEQNAPCRHLSAAPPRPPGRRARAPGPPAYPRRGAAARTTSPSESAWPAPRRAAARG